MYFTGVLATWRRPFRWARPTSRRDRLIGRPTAGACRHRPGGSRRRRRRTSDRVARTDSETLRRTRASRYDTIRQAGSTRRVKYTRYSRHHDLFTRHGFDYAIYEYEDFTRLRQGINVETRTPSYLSESDSYMARTVLLWPRLKPTSSPILAAVADINPIQFNPMQSFISHNSSYWSGKSEVMEL